MSSHDPISLFGLNSDFVKDDYITNIVTSDTKNKIDPLEAYTGFMDKIKNEEMNNDMFHSNDEYSNNDHMSSDPVKSSSIFDSSSFLSAPNPANDSLPNFDMNIIQKSNSPKSENKYSNFQSIPKSLYLSQSDPSPPEIPAISNDDLYQRNNILGQNTGIKNYSYNNNSASSGITQTSSHNSPIDSIIDNYSSFSEQKNNQEEKTYESEVDDKKLILLEKIHNLRDLLAKNEVNLENVPVVNYNSSINEIYYTHRILMIKNNRDLNIDLTGNVIKGVSKILEKVFDGKKSYFGVTLDLTGYTDTVDIQLRRLEPETEKIAGNIMNKTELNPYYKIGLYLVPGMIAHSVLKRKRQNDTVYDNDKLADALNEIKHN